jgi:hypothetical protein
MCLRERPWDGDETVTPDFLLSVFGFYRGVAGRWAAWLRCSKLAGDTKRIQGVA